MIEISKSPAVPAVLSTQGQKAAKKLHARVLSGETSLNFRGDIYGHPSVKRQLITDQHGKCCFCEAKIGPDGDVEHFRPKAAWCQGDGEPLNWPGYYWLAYEWNNLLLCCSACNQRHKRNYFPLSTPSTKATIPTANLLLEDPLFINPVQRDPSVFIAFRKEIAYAINDNLVGATTINSLGLNRENLIEVRRDRLKHLAIIQESIQALSVLPAPNPQQRRTLNDAVSYLSSALEDQAPFASLARCASLHSFKISLP